MTTSGVAMVLEPRLPMGDRAALLRLGEALGQAGMAVRWFDHPAGHPPGQPSRHSGGRRARLQAAVLAQRPALVLTTGGASTRDLQGVATALGAPLVCYLWPGDGDAEGLRGAAPARAVVAREETRRRLASPDLPEERIHVLPVAGDRPDLAAHAELLTEVLDEHGASLGKRLARGWVARLGGAVLRRLGGTPRPVSLVYHQVRAEMRGWDPHLVVSQGTLERQVRALQRDGYTGVTMARQAERVLGGAGGPTLAVTFDDGYADTLEVAAPVLLGLGVPFTVYVVTDVVTGRVRAPWYEVAAQAVLCREARGRTLPLLRADERLRRSCDALPPSPALARAVVAALKDFPPGERDALVAALGEAGGEALYAGVPRYLDLGGVRRLHQAGVEISSHTRSHPILPRLDDEALRAELQESRRALIGLLGGCPGVAYPNGDGDARVQAAARAAGYEYGLGGDVAPGVVPDRFDLRRHFISERTSAGLDHRFDEAVFMARMRGLLH